MSRWILKMSSCGSNAGMETSASLVERIVNNALFHSNSHINQMPPQIIGCHVKIITILYENYVDNITSQRIA